MSGLTRIPTPPAVDVFRTRHLPKPVFEAIVLQGDTERGLARLRPLASVEDQGDREELLAEHACATKTVAGYPPIITAGSLS